MRKIITILTALLTATVVAAPKPHALAPEHIDQIAATLPPAPAGPGHAIIDRPYWQALAQNPAFRATIAKADKLLAKPLPDLPDELFLEFSRNGNRKNYERVAFDRRGRLAPFVLAECLTNTGKYLPAINKLINTYCAEPTWVLPAHDKKLTNFHGSKITIDLFSSALAWELATADYLLGDRLTSDTRATMRREIFRQVILPFQKMIRGERDLDHWMTGTNNWNSVCLAGVTGAALIELPSRRDRAEFIAAAGHYSKYFLSGFTKDGYCSEGVGYWNYGYGRYALMAVNLRLATGDAIDLFKDPKAMEPAAYGHRIEIINGVIPAYSDCSLKAQPDKPLLWLLNQTYGWGIAEYAKLNAKDTMDVLAEAMLYQEAANHNFPPIPGADVSADAGIRTVFDQAGIYICRPGLASDASTTSAANFAVSFKGGNNSEHHNHNDIGSYVVVVGDTPILLDPGPETYTARTFGPNRYESKLLNSFGHAVPVVAGKLQRKGRKAQARILEETFSAASDKVVMDIKSAYKVRGLQKLTRTFEYNRQNGGSFRVTDHVEFNKPREFETAMISLGEFIRTPDGSAIIVKDGKTIAKIQITASAPFEFGLEKIKENGGAKPNRLGIKLKKPVKSATVTMIITPNKNR